MDASVSRWKKIAWPVTFERADPSYVTFQVKPDSGVRNWRTEDLTKTIAESYRLPIERFSKDRGKIRFETQERASFEIVFEGGKVRFYVSVPERVSQLVKRRMQSVWSGATIDAVERRTEPLDANRSAAYQLLYRRHDLYSLHTDSKDNVPLTSILEAGRLLQENETARVCCYLDPIYYPSWASSVREAWEKLKQGTIPQRFENSFAFYVRQTLTGVSVIMREIFSGVSELISDTKEKNAYDQRTPIDLEANRHMIQNLSESTKRKVNKNVTKTYLWVVAEGNDRTRSDTIAKTLALAFLDLNDENELVPRPLTGQHKAEALRTIATHKPPRIRVNYNLFSTAETAKVWQLPGRELQEKFAEIETTSHKEVQVDQRLTGSGMYLGAVTYRGEKTEISQPVAKSDLTYDELCLPHIVIGGMGQGKTKGFAANWMVQAVRNGFGALGIDPAKGELGDEVQAALLPDQVMRVDLAQTVFALDFCEVRHMRNWRTRLAKVLVSFFDTGADELGFQTSRFIKAGIFAMQTTRLAEMLRLFEDKAYSLDCIGKMDDGIYKSTMAQFWNESEGRQRQILSPIFNRLEVLLGDEFLSACMDSDQSLDMLDVLRMKKAVVFDVKKTDLGEEGVDLIVNLLTVKIELAMTAREEKDQTPFWIVFDEPHQYLRSHKTWMRLAVESRKWRVGFVWLFHEWSQLDRNLRRIIKSALPHYHIYPTSKEIWDDMIDIVYPFRLDDCLKLKRFHAINALRVGGDPITPFIAHMAAPPSSAT